MKRAGRLRRALITFTMFFATTAFAANKGDLHLQSPTMAGETQLPAGKYTVQWEGAGPDVQLKIKLQNRVKATVPAKVIPVNRPLTEDAAFVDGDRKLREIRFSGRKFILQIEPQTASTTLSQRSSICPDCQPEMPW